MDYMQVAQTFGVPVAMLAAVCFAIWRVLSWSATNVVKPLVDHAVEFLDKLEANIDRQSKAIEELSKSIRELEQRFDAGRNTTAH